MRALNRKQKQMLDGWWKENKHNYKEGIRFFDVGKADRFSGQLYEEIQAVNDFETFYQAVNNYISNKED